MRESTNLNPTIYKILTSAGFLESELLTVAKLLHICGGLDGEIKTTIEPKVKLDEEVSNLLTKEISLEELNGLLQKNIFKKFRTGERQQIQPSEEISQQRSEITELLREAGFVSDAPPKKDRYDYGLILGATVLGMKGRINQMKEMADGRLFTAVEDGARNFDFGKIFILSGARDLWLDSNSDEPYASQILHERIKEKLDEGKKFELNGEKLKPEDLTEEELKKLGKKVFEEQLASGKNTDLARQEVINYFIKNFEISWPTEADAARKIATDHEFLKGKVVEVIDAPKYPDGKRPDTDATFFQFAKQYPELQGEAIAISNQPHIKTQALSLKLLPKGVKGEMVGKGLINPDSQSAFAETALSELAGYINRYLNLKKYLEKSSAAQVESSSKTSEERTTTTTAVNLLAKARAAAGREEKGGGRS